MILSKALVLCSLAIPVIASAVVFSLMVSHNYIRGGMKAWILSNRASTQIVVQILAQLLGSCQIYALSTIIRFWTNIRLTRTAMSLDLLKALDAVTSARLDLDIRYRALTVLIFYLAVIQVPAALWAGALTPILTTTHATAPYRIPQYSSGSQSTAWGNVCYPATDCGPDVTGNTSELGTFTYIAWKGKL